MPLNEHVEAVAREAGRKAAQRLLDDILHPTWPLPKDAFTRPIQVGDIVVHRNKSDAPNGFARMVVLRVRDRYGDLGGQAAEVRWVDGHGPDYYVRSWWIDADRLRLVEAATTERQWSGPFVEEKLLTEAKAEILDLQAQVRTLRREKAKAETGKAQAEFVLDQANAETRDAVRKLERTEALAAERGATCTNLRIGKAHAESLLDQHVEVENRLERELVEARNEVGRLGVALSRAQLDATEQRRVAERNDAEIGKLRRALNEAHAKLRYAEEHLGGRLLEAQFARVVSENDQLKAQLEALGPNNAVRASRLSQLNHDLPNMRERNDRQARYLGAWSNLTGKSRVDDLEPEVRDAIKVAAIEAKGSFRAGGRRWNLQSVTRSFGHDAGVPQLHGASDGWHRYFRPSEVAV
jgi:hypothetical protein